jgi:plastocyanin
VPARALCAVLPAALLLAIAAAPARAAEYDIAIGPGNQYRPAELTVAPGDTVNWAANATHPLVFDGEAGEYTTPTTRTLTAAGTVAFHCRVHGGSGMTGVVTVSNAPNAPPVLTLARETPAPVAGEPVAFFAEASDPDGDAVQIDWDLDGDGAFELSDYGPVATETYAAAGTRTVAARAVDARNASTVASLSFDVAPAPGRGPDGGPAGAGPGGGGGTNADTVAPTLRHLAVPRSVRVRALRRRGVRIRVTPSEDGTLTATLRDRRGRRLGRARAPAQAGERATLRIRARRARPGTLRLRIVVADAAGNRTVVTRTLVARG